jgi:alginate O-acetyltransferase complex protein AlgI
MVFSTIVDFYAGQLIEKGHRKLGLRISIATNLTTLGFFKYFNFGIDNLRSILVELGANVDVLEGAPEILLPMGISFYVFQTMSYTLDVYRNQAKASSNFIEFATYVTMFPQLVAGPIVRYVDVQRELGHRTYDLKNFSLGLERFIIGLAKKVIIANNVALIADHIFNTDVPEMATLAAWAGLLAYSLQIYFDFSGYSDMAIGLGRMMGFKIPENFNYPYIARSIQDFWRRWHISLSTWFRDYVYIPLGGSRMGSSRTYINLIIVFIVTGLWHGAAWTFVIWGLYHGFFLILERLFLSKILKNSGKVISHFYTLFVVGIGWVMFRSDDWEFFLNYLRPLFIYSEGDQTFNDFLVMLDHHFYHYLITLSGIFLSLPIYRKLDSVLHSKRVQPLYYTALIGLFLLCLTYIASGSYNPFIYYRF